MVTGAEAADDDRCRLSSVGTDGVTVTPDHARFASTVTVGAEPALPPSGVVTGTNVVFCKPVPESATLPPLGTNSDRVASSAGDVTSGTTVVVAFGVEYPCVAADHV